MIVATAAFYAALKLMPRAWRSGLAATAASLARRSGLSDVHARRVEAKLSSGGACGSCDSCKACAAPAAVTTATDTDTDGTSATTTYRRIPIRPL